MSKKVKFLSAVLAALMMLTVVCTGLTACSSGGSDSSAGSESSEDADTAGTDENASADTHIVVDHGDNEIEVPNEINRIVVCDILPLPSVLTVFFDSADKIVGMSQPSLTAAQNGLLGELYPEILNVETGFIDGSTVNTEELMKLEPDVVFYSASNAELGEQLRNAGFAAIAISVNKWNYNCIETLNNWISLLSEIFPDNDKTAVVQEHANASYELVQERVKDLDDSERARAFFLFQYDDTTLLTSGANFFGQWWCDAIGAINVANELTTDNSVAVNMEQIYEWNPDLIFITNFNTSTPDDLYNNTVGTYDWSPVAAVQNKNVFKMPLGMYRSYTPGADTPVTLLWMAKTAYPELFSDIDITEEAKSYYQEVFGIELTDEQVENIFNPSVNAGSGFAYQ